MTVTLIVLINLLIAMMSNTYQRIEAQSDIEWKFGRAKLIRNMNRTLSTPSPINLLIGIPILQIRMFRRQLGNEHMSTFALSLINLELWCLFDGAEENKKEFGFAKQAFGQIATDQNAAAKQWMDRRMSRASKQSKLSRGTQNTNPLGTQSLVEANIVESHPINTIVNWPLIVRKYWESIGVSSRSNEEESSQATSAAATAAASASDVKPSTGSE
jgi:hypothetical protein